MFCDPNDGICAPSVSSDPTTSPITLLGSLTSDCLADYRICRIDQDCCSSTCYFSGNGLKYGFCTPESETSTKTTVSITETPNSSNSTSSMPPMTTTSSCKQSNQICVKNDECCSNRCESSVCAEAQINWAKCYVFLIIGGSLLGLVLIGAIVFVVVYCVKISRRPRADDLNPFF